MKKNGLAYYQELAEKRSNLLYETIDNSDGYYTNPVDKKYRSRMNIPFRINNNEQLENKFLAEAEKLHMIELKGHRSVGGCRASLYNAMSYEGVVALTDFMKKFQQENPVDK